MRIDPNLRGRLPKVDPATPFESPDGRFRGWKVTLPGKHALATPAIADGLIFVGGGFGSYDFFALDARDGHLAWHYQTADDGPTAAVVEDGYVVFNTECCELEVLTVAGAPVWKQWLGDPLMSTPAVANGRVYMAYPDSKGDHRHHLACFDLRDGRQYWRQPIEGELITTPVLAEGHVHFATLGGTLYRVRQDDGHVEWAEPKRATSSPVVWEGECFFSQREEVAEGGVGAPPEAVFQAERLTARKLGAAEYRHYGATQRKADYLDHLKRVAGSPRYAASAHRDAAVGFGAAKGDAKMYQAMANLGTAHVHGVWAYQGSKPFVSRGTLYAAQGDHVSSADPRSDQVHWKKILGEKPEGDPDLLDSPLTPPAIVNGKLFLGSALGKVHCLNAETGDELWSVSVGEPVIFQPAVAGGRVYVGTDAGSVICLETGDPADDGWFMWGADASHNGRLT
ncbi:MAG: PQQ-binding-like beta-propeller repeat protein [Isosphaeraceae bacterium]